MTGRAQPTKGITVHQRGSRWYYRLDLASVFHRG